MRIADFSIRRPVLIVSLVIMMIVIGIISMLRLPIDQFPKVELPYIGVNVIYYGAGPSEMENLIVKPLEDEIRTISGVKKVMSFCMEGYASVFAEFPIESDPNYAEQQMRDRMASARRKMPKGIEEPVVRRYSVSDQPVTILAVQTTNNPNTVYDVAERVMRPALEQVDKVSHVSIFGGSKREIHVLLDRKKLSDYDLPVIQVANALEQGGENIPIGKQTDKKQGGQEWIYRSLGEYNKIEDVQSVIVRFAGNDIPVRVGDIATVVDTFRDQSSAAYLNGKSTLIMNVYRQSGANTVRVADEVKKKLSWLNQILEKDYGDMKVVILRDGAKNIKDNVKDVFETILIGIFLTIIVVFFFLGTIRSTLITGIAIPNSLIGAFMLVSLAGFSINILTLMALSLAVGLLIDDAIVVRENIFRHMELGEDPETAAKKGTAEVGIAVIATTLAILSVFGPIAFIKGIIGMFLKEFGLTVCFIMLISLFDALTVGPMLSARYGKPKHERTGFDVWWERNILPTVKTFDRFIERLRQSYTRFVRWTVDHPRRVVLISFLVSLPMFATVLFLPKTFLPSMDSGEMRISLELPPGSDLESSKKVALEAEEIVRRNKEVEYTSTIAGNDRGDPTFIDIYTKLVPTWKRTKTTRQVKETIREDLKPLAQYRVKIGEYDALFGGSAPFNLNLRSDNPELLEETAKKVLELMKENPGFVEADIDSRPGKPELRLKYDEEKTKLYGISTRMAGAELRAQMEGLMPAKFRELGKEWDIRVRLREEDRDLRNDFDKVLIPNMNYRLVNLDEVAEIDRTEGPSTIQRQYGQRVIGVTADIAKDKGLGDLMKWLTDEIERRGILPEEVKFAFEGQAEQFQEMAANMIIAVVLAILFIYFVLASLYESFIMPWRLLIPLPFAAAGAFLMLFIARQSLNIYSIIASIMLLGVATKNSILLIDFFNQLIAKGMDLKDAIVEAGRTRLRPILMTSMTLVAGTLPLAIGLNEASRQRSSMGWVIIGGVISSTILSLVIIPAILAWTSKRKVKKLAEVHQLEKGH